MSAEGMPQEEPSFLAGPLGWTTRLITRNPLPVLACGVALAVLALALSANRLGFRTSRLDLLNPDCGYNRLWIEYINEFGDEDDVVVVVEGADRDHVVPVLEELSAALTRQNHFFHAVLHEVDLSKIRAKGLHYLPPEQLLQIERLVAQTEPIVAGDWARLNLGNMANDLCRQLEATGTPQSAAARSAAEAELGRLSESLHGAFREDRYRSPWPGMPCSVATISELSDEYLLTNEGRLGFVLLRLVKDDKDSFIQGSEALDALRRLVDRVAAYHPETAVGLTGLPVLENDEMRSSQTSMLEASLLSLLGVACLFIAGFGGIRHPVMTVLALLIAMAWSFGFITLAVGHLNILSMAFGVILIGLGVDFGVHYVARYLQLRSHIHRSDEALVQAARSVGPGVCTGAITTAVAFLTAALTKFTGVAELGIIAGGGIVLCLVAAMTILPAMIQLSDQRRVRQPLPAPLDIDAALRPLLGRPGWVLGGALAGTVALSLGIQHLWYDHNLLNLQPEGLESVELERKLLSEADQSVWFALSIAESRDELLKRKERFLGLDSIERVEEIASLLPADQAEKAPIIERIYRRLSVLPERAPDIPVDPPADLDACWRGLRQQWPAGRNRRGSSGTWNRSATRCGKRPWANVIGGCPTTSSVWPAIY